VVNPLSKKVKFFLKKGLQGTRFSVEYASSIDETSSKDYLDRARCKPAAIGFLETETLDTLGLRIPTENNSVRGFSRRKVD